MPSAYKNTLAAKRIRARSDAARERWADPEYRERVLGSRRVSTRRINGGDGFLYAAEIVGTDAVKIGFALDPEGRVSDLKSIYRKRRFRLLAVTPGTFHQEQELHVTLRELRHPEFARRREFYPRSILSHPAIPEALRVAA